MYVFIYLPIAIYFIFDIFNARKNVKTGSQNHAASYLIGVNTWYNTKINPINLVEFLLLLFQLFIKNIETSSNIVTKDRMEMMEYIYIYMLIVLYDDVIFNNQGNRGSNTTSMGR